jgi:uncharacterized protein YlxP (DUF503 family)
MDRALAMRVATLRLELVILECQSLREKRRRMQAIITKVRRHFNVSVAEVDLHDWPSTAVLGVAAVGNSRWEVRSLLNRVADALSVYPRAELVQHSLFEV